MFLGRRAINLNSKCKGWTFKKYCIHYHFINYLSLFEPVHGKFTWFHLLHLLLRRTTQILWKCLGTYARVTIPQIERAPWYFSPPRATLSWYLPFSPSSSSKENYSSPLKMSWQSQSDNPTDLSELPGPSLLPGLVWPFTITFLDWLRFKS